ncbi:MAG: tetratricopeptide repeat protein [Saprospiraceae bacterium]
MIYKKIAFLFFVVGILKATIVSSQETAWYDTEVYNYHQAKDYFDDELYGQAINSATLFLNKLRATKNLKDRSIYFHQAQSLLYIAQLRLELPDAENNLKSYIDKYHPNPMLLQAVFELGNYYYNDKNYAACVRYLERIDLGALKKIQQSELLFKLGYCNFVRKEFKEAKSSFGLSRNIQNKFFYPVNYYYGMCEYFEGDYSDAIKSFQRVENNNVYKSHIPYYIAQIYFAEKQYNELITYGESAILKTGIKKIAEIRQLLGQTYFLNKEFDKALPHLQYYESHTQELTAESFYQLGFSYYKLNRCDEAIDVFLELHLQDSKLGQVVNYYLADCYERKNDLVSARATFKKVSQMNYNRGMKEEATFNYGKLSAQMGQDREAINVLMNIETQSPYFTESNKIVNDILVNTGDYENAINILESFNGLNKDLENTYQQVTFKMGVQKIAGGNLNEAKSYFTKSDKYQYDPNIIAQIDFWRATWLNEQGEYKASNIAYEKYFESLKKASNIPIETRSYVAYYNMAYNFLKMKEYIKAADNFKKTITGINTEMDNIPDATLLDRMLPDAYARAGDCYFKVRRFDDATTYYDQYIDRKSPGYTYALFQRGIIEGLVDQPYEKILTLEKLVKENPSSEYADNALQHLGDTYLSFGNPIAASISYKKIITDYGEKSNLRNAANLKLGLINYNAGDIEGALTYYKSIFRNNPKPKESQEAILAIEEIYIDDLGQTDEYFNFIKSVPGYEVSSFAKDSLNYRIGEIQFQNGNYEKAIVGFNDYLKVFSQGYYRLDAHYYRGESRALSKKYNKALLDYSVIIKEGFSNFYKRSLKKAALISYNHSANFSQAFKYFRLWEDLTQDPEEKYQAQMGAMHSAYRINDYISVLKYGNMISSNPLATSTDKYIAMFYLGKGALADGKLDKAKKAFERITQSSNNSVEAAEARFLLAHIDYEKGNYTSAKTTIEKANRNNNNYPYWIAKGILLLSDIHVKNNDLLNARAAVEAVLENFKSDDDIVKQANTKMNYISELESGNNRIKNQNADGSLELDTSGN